MEADEGSYQPAYERTEGPKLVLLFVGSSTGSASADPELPEMVRLGLDAEQLLIYRQGAPDLLALAELPVKGYLDARLGETLGGSDP